jgi:hypothetical protein
MVRPVASRVVVVPDTLREADAWELLPEMDRFVGRKVRITVEVVP